jgi:hypothetical protein
MTNDLLSLPQVAALLGLSDDQLYRACKSGRVHPLAAGRSQLFRAPDVEQLRALFGEARDLRP